MPGGLIRGFTHHLTPVSPGMGGRTDPLDRGLVGEWRFDPATGLRLTDYSGYGSHGVVNGPTWVSGEYGPGLDFERDASHYVDLGSSGSVSNLGAPASFEAFLDFESIAADEACIFENGARGGTATGIEWFTHASDRVYVWNGNAFVFWDNIVGVGLYHLIVTVGATTAYLYVNGVQQASKAFTFGAPAGATAQIGRWNVAEHYDGIMYLLRAYNRVLSPGEPLARYQIVRRRVQGLGGVWMMPWGKAAGAMPIFATAGIHSVVFGGQVVR